LLFIINRDKTNPVVFFGKHKILAWGIIGILSLGVLIGTYTRFVEPNIININNQTIKINKLEQPLKIAFIADIQIGNHKKSSWMEKIVKKIETIKPDLIIWGGDLIDNEGNTEDESQYLEPISKLVGRYPMYYIMGNHEYGIGNKTKRNDARQTGDRSAELTARMKKIGVPLLRNQLACHKIKNQTICLFGTDDIWSKPINFDELKNWPASTPIIFLTHNPDGITLWPNEIQKPDFVLSGHTHGGQIWLPGYGPLGRAGVDLGSKYYKGLNYYKNIPIFTSVGIGESGGPVRLFVPPEIAVIKLQ